MMDYLVRKADPPILRQHLHQLLLHRLRRISLCQTQTMRNPKHMRIHDDAFRKTIRNAEHYVRRLPCRAGNGDQLRQCLRNLAAKLLRDLLRRA